MKALVRELYRVRYDTELKAKLERVREKTLATFLEDSKMYQFDQFAIELHKNIPNQNSRGISELLDNLGKDSNKAVNLAEKAELLLLGKFKEYTWNNGSVARYISHFASS